MSMIILYPVLIGIFASVYRLILAHEPVLNWWFRFGIRWEDYLIHKPIWGCEKCIAGQWCLWLILLNIAGNYPGVFSVIWGIVPRLGVNTLNFYTAVCMVSLSIFTAFVSSHFIQHLKNRF